MNDASTPARLYAGLVGAVLVVAGIIGFFYNSDFTSNEAIHDDVLGILSVNGWHNVVHLVTGGLGLLAFLAGARASRTYALVVGAVYIVVAVWGFIIGSGDSILGIVPINTEDSVLHLILGIVGLGAGLASPAGRVALPEPA
jgi:zinc transporter ZupT